MAVSDGQPVNASVTNAAYLSRTVDSDTVAKITLDDPDVVSGDTINNAQRYINEIADSDGTDGEGDATRKQYSSNNVVTDGDDRKTAIGKLDGEFDVSTGHDHDGVNSKAVSAANLDNFNNLFAEFQVGEENGVSGLTYDISADFAAKSPGGDSNTAGVITTAPNNRVELIDNSNGGEIEDGSGRRVYARLTESSGTWTLSFYVNDAGVETAYNLPSTDISYLYREVFTAETRPTIPASLGLFDSLNVTADVVDATPSQPGKVNTGAQSFGGVKEFVDRPTTGTDPIVSETAVQDVSNKAIIDPSRLDVKKDTLANLTTYASTATDGQLCFATDTQELYQIFSNSLQQIGAGGGGGSQSSYLVGTDFDAEDGLGNWVTFDEGAVTVPTTGTGGSPAISLAVTAVNPLEKTQSFIFQKDAVNRQGHGWSVPFSIYEKDINQNILLYFPFATTANYVTGDIGVWVRDETSGEIIELTERDIVSKVNGYHGVTFKARGTLNYRLIFMIRTTSALAYDFKFDEVILWHSLFAVGPAATDWKPVTLTFNNITPTSFIGYYKYEGSDLLLTFYSTISAVTGTFEVNLPFGHTIDSAKINFGGGTAIPTIGTAMSFDSSAGLNYVGAAVTGTVNTRAAFRGHANGIFSNTSPFAWTAGDFFAFNLKVPVVGQGAGTIESLQSGNRDLVIRANKSTGSHSTTGAFETVTSWGGGFDTAGQFNPTTGVFTALEDGRVFFHAITSFVAATGLQTCLFRHERNAVLVEEKRGSIVIGNGTQATTLQGSVAFDLRRGDTVFFRTFQSSGGVLNYVADGAYNHFNAFKIQSPQSVLGGLRYDAMYGDGAGQAMTTATPFLANTKIRDNFGTQYNGVTGQFKAPFTGDFVFNCGWISTAYSAPVGTLAQVQIGGVSNNYHLSQNATVMQRMSNHLAFHYLTKGQTINTLWNNNTGGGVCVAAPFFTFMQIKGWN
jgi:hypothetical protein